MAPLDRYNNVKGPQVVAQVQGRVTVTAGEIIGQLTPGQIANVYGYSVIGRVPGLAQVEADVAVLQTLVGNGAPSNIPQSSVDNLEADLANRALVGHVHSIANVSNLRNELDYILGVANGATPALPDPLTLNHVTVTGSLDVTAPANVHDLHVSGNLTGVSIGANIDLGNVDAIGANSLTVAGPAAFFDANVSNRATVNDLVITGTVTGLPPADLGNVDAIGANSLSVSGNASLGNVSSDSASFVDLALSNSLTVAGPAAFLDASVSNSLTVAGPAAFFDLSVANYLEANIAYASALTIAGNADVAEAVSANVVTANAFLGDGSQLTGIGVPDDIVVNSVTANALTSLGDAGVAGNLGVEAVSANVVTANAFLGDGSQLTGIGVPDDIVANSLTANSLTVSGLSTLFDIAASNAAQVGYIAVDSDASVGANLAVASKATVGDDDAGGVYSLTVTGTVYATREVYAFSDARHKRDLLPIEDPLGRVAALSAYTYAFDDGRRRAGLLAQDVRAVLPEAVGESGGELALSYNGVTALCAEALKEVAARLGELDARLGRVENRLAP